MTGKNQNQGNGKVVILRRGRKPNIQNRLKKYKPNNNQNGNDNNNPPRNKRQMIAKNLSTLKENIRKKQFAQERYYQHNSSNRSPLIRQSQPLNNVNNGKTSVHKRLGRQNLQVKNNINNTNKNNSNKNVALRQNKAQKVINIKRRFNKVRAQQQQQQQQQQIKNGNSFLQNNQTKKIVLRRTRPQPANNVNPMNYTVQVRNDAPVKHHTELNPRLQAEIKMIQQNSHVHEIVQAMPLHPAGSGITKTTLNERFSHF